MPAGYGYRRAGCWQRLIILTVHFMKRADRVSAWRRPWRHCCCCCCCCCWWWWWLWSWHGVKWIDAVLHWRHDSRRFKDEHYRWDITSCELYDNCLSLRPAKFLPWTLPAWLNEPNRILCSFDVPAELRLSVSFENIEEQISKTHCILGKMHFLNITWKGLSEFYTKWIVFNSTKLNLGYMAVNNHGLSYYRSCLRQWG